MATLEYRPKQVRLFLVILLAIAVLFTLKSTPRTGAGRWLWLGGEAMVLGFFIAAPKIFFPAFRLIMAVTSKIGSLIFLIVSTVVFFLLLTPLALIMRLFGKKFMLVRRSRKTVSYFEAPAPEGDFERQF
ncbi:MAG: SxtJ family membrane protein [Candidatus Aminicenantes bacterium]|nr:SxtJ family membrane protein [Candidatus Aminicenantes bacterium]